MIITQITTALLLACVLNYNLNAEAFSIQKSTVTSKTHSSSSLLTMTNSNDNDNSNIRGNNDAHLPDRRNLFQQMTAFASTTLLTTTAVPSPAHAGSLVQFPVGPETQQLKNRYHFMRAGLSELEEQHIYSTNPLFLTNRENELSPRGNDMILDTISILKSLDDGFPTIAYHSLAANGMDTGDLIARELRLGRERLLPEFTYLDQRGVGLWDSGDEALVKPAVWALDYNEAGKLGKGGRPPAHEDGTPNETLGDQFVRLRQFISLQESRTSGDNILVIFPDGTGPALLSCMIAGIPYKDVHALEFAPGELRLDITPASVWKLFDEKKEDPTYLAMLEKGQANLQELQQHPPTVALKEQKMQQERMELEAAYVEKQKAAEQQERERQTAIAKQREEMKQKELARKAEKEQKELARKAGLEEKKRLKLAEQQQLAASRRAADSPANTNGNDNGGDSINSLIATAALGVGGLGFAVLGTSGASPSDSDVSAVSNDMNPVNPSSSSEAEEVTMVGEEEEEVASNSNVDSVEKQDIKVDEVEAADNNVNTVPSPSSLSNAADDDTNNKTQKAAKEAVAAKVDETNPVPRTADMDMVTTDEINDDINDLEEFDQILAAGEQVMKDVLREQSPTIQNTDSQNDNDETSDDEVIQNQLQQLAAGEQVMKDVLKEEELLPETTEKKANYIDEYPENYADDWLQIMSEIRDEEDDEEEEAQLKMNSRSGDQR